MQPQIDPQAEENPDALPRIEPEAEPQVEGPEIEEQIQPEEEEEHQIEHQLEHQIEHQIEHRLEQQLEQQLEQRVLQLEQGVLQINARELQLELEQVFEIIIIDDPEDAQEEEPQRLMPDIQYQVPPNDLVQVVGRPNYIFKRKCVEQICHSSMLSPVARSGHRIVHSIDNLYIYLYGGFSDSLSTNEYSNFNPDWRRTKPLFQELWRFSKLTRTWAMIKTTGEAPREVASHCMVMLDSNTLVVFGGTRFPFGRIRSNQIYTCDLTRNVWKRLRCHRNSQLPKEHYGQGVVLDRANRYLYVCGGTNGLMFSLELHRYNFATCKWTRLYGNSGEELLGPRYRHELALWKGKIYVVGGANLANAYSNMHLPVFNLEAGKWSLVLTKPFIEADGSESYPAPRYSHEGGQYGGRIYICGGTDGTVALQDVWSLDLDKLEWRKEEEIKLPHPLYFHSASISTEGEMVLFGGVTSIRPKVRTNAIYSIWINVPSLQTMANNATLYRMRLELMLGRSFTRPNAPEGENMVSIVKSIEEENDVLDLDDNEPFSDQDVEQMMLEGYVSGRPRGQTPPVEVGIHRQISIVGMPLPVVSVYPEMLITGPTVEAKLLPLKIDNIIKFYLRHKAHPILTTIFNFHEITVSGRKLPCMAGNSSHRRRKLRDSPEEPARTKRTRFSLLR